jgi:MOSC domain-containing protein YiiM
MTAMVAAVACAAGHGFSKAVVPTVTLVAGIGVAGDGHAGETVQHRSRVAIDPAQPNLRQVHLLHAELLDELVAQGFAVAAGDMGENILLRGVDLLGLPVGARLALGTAAVVELTGLRNPCAQLDRFQRGLMQAVIGRGPAGEIVRKAGVMAIVITGGVVAAGDGISIVLPPLPHAAMGPV